MAGYTFKWRCRICDELQDTIDCPRPQVCDKCLKPVAEMLCQGELEHSLSTRGVNSGYWMIEAQQLVGLLMLRWTPLQQREIPRRILEN